jgi:CHAT domain-containing protein/Tfp pilus assembly protein PilF
MICSYPQEIQKPENIKQLYQKYYHIRKLGAENKIEDALNEHKNFIEEHPHFYEIFRSFVRMSKDSGKLDGAISYFKELITNEPSQPVYFYGIGLCYKALGNRDKASENLKTAIEKGGSFIRLYYDLLVMANTENESLALIDYFENRANLSPDNSMLYYGIGALFQFKLKKYNSAIEGYKRALDIARSTGNKREEGQHLNTIGNYYWGRGDLRTAQSYYLNAVSVIQHTGNKVELAKYLYNSGLIQCWQGNPIKGREFYEMALETDLEVGNKIHEAQILRSIGYTYYQTSQFPLALNYYKQALQIAREVVDKPGEIRYLLDIGEAHWVLGKYHEAIESYKNSLSQSQRSGDKNTEYLAYNHLGNSLWKIGEYSKALHSYSQSLKISREIGHRLGEATALNNSAIIFDKTGNLSKALEYYGESLKIFDEAGAKSSQGICLNNIAGIHYRQHNYPLSLEYYDQALKLAQETGEKRAEANRLKNIAKVYGKLNKFSEAEKHYSLSLAKARAIGINELEARIYGDMGYSFIDSNNFTRSIQSFTKALTIAQELGLPETTWLSHSGLGTAYEKQKKPADAIDHYKKAITAIEDVRSQIELEEHKSGFLESKVKVYESLINVLFTQSQQHPGKGYEKEAFHYAEKAKARVFLDSLQTSKINLRETLPLHLREEEHKLSRNISKIQTELIKPGLNQTQREVLFRNLESVENDYSNFIQILRMENPEYALLVYPEPDELEKIQTSLQDDKTAIIEYFLGQDHSFVFLIEKNRFSMHRLVQSSDLQARVSDYLKLVSVKDQNGEFRASKAGKRLFKDLIGPFENNIKGISKLIVIPDGKLCYLPYEALILSNSQNQDQFLIETFRISYAPSASSWMMLSQRKKAEKPVKDFLAFADPEFSFGKSSQKEIDADQILREFYLEQGFDFSPLHYSGREVKYVSKLFKRKSREVYTRRNAKEERLKNLPLENYQIIHFATHGFIDEQVPHRSALILTLDEDPAEDGFFQAREVFNLRLNSRLVVLSACQTGRGKLEKGEGVIGLYRSFLFAGAQTVLMSLWNINDKATAKFMEYFYKDLTQGLSKGKALQRAKIKMLNSEYSHPFYWAAFVLNGEDRSSVKIEKPSFWDRIF